MSHPGCDLCARLVWSDGDGIGLVGCGVQKSDRQQFEGNSGGDERNIATKRNDPEWNHPAYAECREHEP
jgi:hypothetical protein